MVSPPKVTNSLFERDRLIHRRRNQGKGIFSISETRRHPDAAFCYYVTALQTRANDSLAAVQVWRRA